MWVILAFGDSPKITVLPGPEYQTESDCVRAAHVHADFDSQRAGVPFSFCGPKDIVQFGRASPT